MRGRLKDLSNFGKNNPIMYLLEGQADLRLMTQSGNLESVKCDVQIYFSQWF